MGAASAGNLGSTETIPRKPSPVNSSCTGVDKAKRKSFHCEPSPKSLCYLTLSRFCGIIILETKLSLNTRKWQKTTNFSVAAEGSLAMARGLLSVFLVSERAGCS
jgi:hypothetical protein